MDGPEWNAVSDEFLPVALRWRDRGHRHVLDLGCGVGRHSLLLAELGMTVTASDISASGLAKLEQSAGERGLSDFIETRSVDMLELSFPEDSFDAIVAFHSIYHTDTAGLRTVLAAMRGWLRPGGDLFVTFNSKRSPDFGRPEDTVLDPCAIVKTSGSETGIPHTFVNYDDIVSLMDGFTVRRARLVQDIYDSGSKFGWHYFIEAE